MGCNDSSPCILIWWLVVVHILTYNQHAFYYYIISTGYTEHVRRRAYQYKTNRNCGEEARHWKKHTDIESIEHRKKSIPTDIVCVWARAWERKTEQEKDKKWKKKKKNAKKRFSFQDDEATTAKPKWNSKWKCKKDSRKQEKNLTDNRHT